MWSCILGSGNWLVWGWRTLTSVLLSVCVVLLIWLLTKQEGLEEVLQNDLTYYGSTTQKTTTTLNATCDDVMKVYFDGEEQSQTPAMKKHNEISQLSIPAGTRVVAIECQNLGGGYGILASTSTGLKTDTFWRCSSKMIEDWTKPSFVYPPETFASPKILGNNDGARLPYYKGYMNQHVYLVLQSLYIIHNHLFLSSSLTSLNSPLQAWDHGRC